MIGIIREPQYVIESIKKRGKQDDKTAVFRWERAVEILHLLIHEDPSTIALVAYEQLTQNPRQTIEKLCKFLDVSYEDIMLEGYRYTPQYKNYSGILKPRRNNIFQNFRENIDKRYLDYYDNLLSNLC
jgi:hypothetical protein